MKDKLLISILLALLFASALTAGLNISRVAADPTTLLINPSTVTKNPSDLGSTFTVSVNIQGVSDLFGFDMNITWDNTLITFSSLDDTPLNTVFVNYFTPLGEDPNPVYQTGAGYVRFAAVKTGQPPGFSGSATLFTLTFLIMKADNFPHSTSIHFDSPNVKLSDSAANPIPATLTDGSYSMSATVPDIDFTLVNPNSAKPYEYGKYFEIQIHATHINSTLTDYDLKVDYTSELLAFYGTYAWGALGTGSVDTGTPGVVHLSISSGTPSTGNNILLFTLTFQVRFDDSIGHIWRTTSPHTLSASVSLDTTYGDLSFLEGTLKVDGTGPTPITLPSTVDLTINLIQGDVTCNGVVDIFDLATVAHFYDQSVPPAPAKYDVRTDGTMDIFDLVVVATNFNYQIPDSPPT